MVFDPGLVQGATLSNQELCSVFKCSTQGGMRRSKETNSLVLIAKQYPDSDVPYYDTWNGSIFHYTGMGMQGDQSLDSGQNKTLVVCNESFKFYSLPYDKDHGKKETAQC